MNEAIIKYFGEDAKVNCDGNCKKAFGYNNRPKIQLSDDDDDVVYLADGEVGDAPGNPGTYECGIGKPLSSNEFPTKWCVRECERCAVSDVGQSELPLPVNDWSERTYNIPQENK